MAAADWDGEERIRIQSLGSGEEGAEGQEGEKRKWRSEKREGKNRAEPRRRRIGLNLKQLLDWESGYSVDLTPSRRQRNG
jgi:hypothetical protein